MLNDERASSTGFILTREQLLYPQETDAFNITAKESFVLHTAEESDALPQGCCLGPSDPAASQVETLLVVPSPNF